MRTYNSSRIWAGKQNDELVGHFEKSPVGLGWSMHMGIVRNPSGNGSSNPFLPDNPVVEMPDGSQHVFYQDKDDPTIRISKDSWIYENIGVGKWELKLPDGTKYTFESNLNPGVGYLTGHSTGSIEIAQATKIEHPNGAVITITYDKVLTYPAYTYLDTIQVGSRTVSFVYDLPNQRLTSIKLNGATFLNYYYLPVNVPKAGGLTDFLDEVKPPVGNSWNYTYHTTGATPTYLLNKTTYPYGGSVEYTYDTVTFDTGGQNIPFKVVNTRKTDDQVTAMGTWTYSYNNSGTQNYEVKTIINGPDNLKEEHTFVGWPNASYGDVWSIGLPTRTEVFENALSIYLETNTWIKSAFISYDDQTDPLWYGFPTIRDINIWSPLLSEKTITRDGRTYTTTYELYDKYGNPGTVKETGDSRRVTTYTNYFEDTVQNIVKGKPGKVRITGDSGYGVYYPGSYDFDYQYNAGDGSVKQVKKYGIHTDYTYWGGGNLQSKTDAEGNLTLYEWSNGLVSKITTPQYVIDKVINPNGTVASKTNGRGHSTGFTYDANLRLKSVTPPIGNVTNITYPADNSYRQESRGGYVVTHNFDGFGRQISAVDPKGITTSTVYRSSGTKDYTYSSIGDDVFYDYFGRTIKRNHQDNTFITYYYSLGNITITDEENKTKTLDYNTFGTPEDKFLVSVTDAESKVTSYDYNIAGSLTSITQGGGVTRTFVFDTIKNWLNSETHPEKGNVTYPTRYATGHLKQKTDSLGTTTYTYDGVNRVNSISNSPESISLTYEGPSLVKTMVNPLVSTTYNYDATDLLYQKTDVINTQAYTTDYFYDDNDNLTHIYYPAGRHIEYTYDLTKNQVTSVIDHGVNDSNGFGSIVQNIIYATGSNAGQLQSFDYSNGLTTTINYNNRNLVTDIDVPVNSVLDLHYTYYDRGNLWSITDNFTPSKNQDFTYDNVNRLRNFNGPWGTGDFTYDTSGLGNRQTKVVSGVTTSYNYTNNRLTSTVGGENSTYGYNGDGDLNSLTTGGQTYIPVYDNFHNLIRYETSGVPLAEFEYNGAGKRVTKTASGKTTVYHYDQSGNVISETDESNNLLADYVYLYGKLVAKITVLPTPAISVTPVLYDFGSVDSGSTSAPQTFTISSIGTGDLVLGTLGLTGASASEFVIQSDNCSGQTLSPTTNCTVDVLFSPTSTGVKGANLSILSNDPVTPTLDVPLTGTGVVYPIISAAPVSYDFGSVDSGSMSAPHTFTVSNIGTDDLIIGTLGLTGASAAEFVIQSDNCSGQTLSPTTNCTVDVLFSPTSTGVKGANLSIPSNDPVTPTLDVLLTGTGVQYQLDVSKAGTGSGTVTSTPAGINCGIDCNELLNPGISITLTAIPDNTNLIFSGWSGGGCTGTGDCVLTINANTTVTATFDVIPPVAGFTGSPTTGPAPLLGNFTDNSLRPASWSWNFGDSATSTEQNPTHLYTTAGNYTVSLTVTNAGGSDVDTKTDYISVQVCPYVSIRIAGETPVYYQSLQAAYDDAQDGAIIQTSAITLAGSLNAGRPINVTIEGGYDCGYTAKVGSTVLSNPGDIDVTAGSVAIGDFSLE
jgi:YD repeat-containing protein